HGEPLELAGGDALERLHRLPHARRTARERAGDARAVRPGKQGEQLVADPVPEELRIAVGLILDPRKPRAAQLLDECQATALEERPDHAAAHRRDPGEPARTRAL